MHKPKMGIKPINVLPLGFIVVILTGALLLMLPFSSKDGRSLSFLDAVFTADAKARTLAGQWLNRHGR